jgi:hypothetical protein
MHLQALVEVAVCFDEMVNLFMFRKGYVECLACSRQLATLAWAAPPVVADWLVAVLVVCQCLLLVVW